MFITPVEDGLGIMLLGEQDVAQDTGDPVCRRGDRLRGSKLGAQAPEELSKVALCTANRVGAWLKSKSSPAFHFARFPGQNLAHAGAIILGVERREL